MILCECEAADDTEVNVDGVDYYPPSMVVDDSVVDVDDSVVHVDGGSSVWSRGDGWSCCWMICLLRVIIYHMYR